MKREFVIANALNAMLEKRPNNAPMSLNRLPLEAWRPIKVPGPPLQEQVTTLRLSSLPAGSIRK